MQIRSFFANKVFFFFFAANVCANIQCAKEAECRETELGPVCECFSGYVDISRQHGMAAGHVCRKLVELKNFQKYFISVEFIW